MITRVNPQLCAGHKVCNIVCPEVFKIDEFGYAYVAEGMESPPEELWEKVREADRQCPEAAIVVEDPYQSRGLGTHLLRRLWAYARGQGIRYWVAEINAENAPMMKFIQRGTLPTVRSFEGGSWQVKIDIAPQTESG